MRGNPLLAGFRFRLRGCILFCFLSCFALPSFAQSVVVITRLQQVIRLSPAWRSVLNEESFPGNLQKDSAWNKQVTSRTQQLVGQKWNGARVLFRGKEAVQFLLNSQPVLATPVIEGDRSQGSIFVAVTQGISLTTTAIDSAGMPVRNFTNTCMVRAEDVGGKLLWESRIIVPFSTVVKPGMMYGQSELSKDDLAQLFSLSLQTALTHSSKRLPNQVFYRPTIENAQWSGFLEKAQNANLEEEIPEFLPRRGEARQTKLVFTEGAQRFPFEMSQQFIGNSETPSGIILTRGQLKNGSTGQEYQVIAELALPTEEAASVEQRRKTPISVRCTVDGLVAGRFTLTHQNFEGEWGYEVYNFRKVNPKNTLEIRLNDKLVAVIQRGGITHAEGRKVRRSPILLHKDLSPTEKADLFSVFLVYQLAYTLGQDYLEY